MPLPALGEVPQLTALSLAWRRLVDLKPVLLLVNNTGLVCCWEQSGRWQQRVVGWPEGVCRDGVRLQREAVGELIVDLIFDCDCPGAELVLCLPLDAASWCVVDGYGADGSPGLMPRLQSVDLPFELAESYVTSSPVQEALAVVGVPRSLIQGWSEVVELADLPLRRVDWLLTAAQRALHQLTQTWDGDLAWLVEEEKSLRLLLFRQGVPEVDHALDALDGDLPLIGSLFRSSESTRLKDELVILVTPRVLDDDQGGAFGYGYRPATKQATQLMQNRF